MNYNPIKYVRLKNITSKPLNYGTNQFNLPQLLQPIHYIRASLGLILICLIFFLLLKVSAFPVEVLAAPPTPTVLGTEEGTEESIKEEAEEGPEESPEEGAEERPEEDIEEDKKSTNEGLPRILEVQEGDRHAIIYWNSKTALYEDLHDPDKEQGIYSYRIEWGVQGEGYPHSEVTPYRVFLAQPLEPRAIYEARVYNIDAYGNLSEPSEPVQFQHDPTRVNEQRTRLNGFFDDFNRPMGAFDELKWNMAFSGCVKAGQGGHHINHEFHAHTSSKSGDCDRAVTNARAREVFDFTGRTGTIEFDLDGSKRTRQLWYLDFYPAGPDYDAGRKRDISGHVALDTVGEIYADPAYLLRFVQEGTNGRTMNIKYTDANGQIQNLKDFTDVYRNGACGRDMRFCEGENFETIPNVRRHFRIEISRTDVRMFINDTLIIDASLVPIHESGGLPYERAHIVWLLFSYNTTKENISRSMVHWDNFGFDAPANYQKSRVIHNYTNGRIGPDEPAEGNEKWGGPKAKMDHPLLTTIPIPDQLLDTAGVAPKAELMFTLQGTYQWPEEEQFIVLNEGTPHEKRYTLPKPTSDISRLPFDRIVDAIVPHSVILPIDVALPNSPGGLIQGNNDITFHLNNVSVFNIHVELTYPVATEPPFTQPAEIFADYAASNMPDPGPVGPNIVFTEIAGEPTWDPKLFTTEIDSNGHPVRFTKINPVSGRVPIKINANTDAQLASIGHTTGISHYQLLVDQQPISTIHVDSQSPVAYFTHQIEWDTSNLPDGMYEFFVKAYDPQGNPSYFDKFQANSTIGEYLPFEITVQNGNTPVLISSQVEFSARGAAGSDKWIEPLSIKLTKPGATEPNYHLEATTNNLGQYSLPAGRGIIPGEYDMWVKGAHTLAARQRVTLTAGQNIVSSLTLLEGDADNDNVVTLVDFSILAAAYDTCQTDQNYDERTDFNEDGCINSEDLALLSANFGQSGASFTEERRSPITFDDTAQNNSLICLVSPTS